MSYHFSEKPQEIVFCLSRLKCQSRTRLDQAALVLGVRAEAKTHFSIPSRSWFSMDSSSSVLSLLSRRSLLRQRRGIGVELVGMVDDGEEPGVDACDTEA